MSTTEELAIPPANSISDRVKAILAKTEGGIPKTGEPEPAEAEPVAADGEADETDPATPDAKTKEAEKPKPGEKPAEKKQGTARAREWADLKSAREETAKAIREAKRITAEATRERAELQKMQEGMRELEKLRKENPKEFLKRVGDGDMRKLFKAALEEPEQTPEQKEIAELKAAMAELKSNETAREKAAREQREKEQSAAASADERAFHSKNLTTVRGVIDHPDAGLERLAAQPAAMKNIVARAAYDHILAEFDRTGQEPNISSVLSALEQELFPVEQPASDKEPPAQANGAEPTAKPGAKRAPVLSSAAATARASSPRPKTFEEKLRASASKLRRA